MTWPHMGSSQWSGRESSRHGKYTTFWAPECVYYTIENMPSVVCLLSKCSFLFFLSLSAFCLSLPEPETKLIAKALLWVQQGEVRAKKRDSGKAGIWKGRAPGPWSWVELCGSVRPCPRGDCATEVRTVGQRLKPVIWDVAKAWIMAGADPASRQTTCG